MLDLQIIHNRTGPGKGEGTSPTSVTSLKELEAFPGILPRGKLSET